VKKARNNFSSYHANRQTDQRQSKQNSALELKEVMTEQPLVQISRTRHWASTNTRWHFAFKLCCHSNETRESIANSPNKSQIPLR